MTIFTINNNDEMVEAPKVQLERELQLEVWLSKSPWAIANEDLLIIGRQTRANLGSNNRYPDLLGVDIDGKIVIIELKRGRAPREVVAQILEYAAWAIQLSESQILEIASSYLNEELYLAFKNHYELDEVPTLGSGLRLFIAAEEVPTSVSEICRFLRQNLGLDISCVSYETYRDKLGNTLVDSSLIVGGERIAGKASYTQANQNSEATSFHWNGQIPVKDIIWQAVNDLGMGQKEFIFSPKDIIEHIRLSYPEANKSTVRCQISADCVNHPSRHHWPGGYDRYWQIGTGKYRLYQKDEDAY